MHSIKAANSRTGKGIVMVEEKQVSASYFKHELICKQSTCLTLFPTSDPIPVSKIEKPVRAQLIKANSRESGGIE